MTNEQKLAASDRMKAMHAAKKLDRETAPLLPVTVELAENTTPDVPTDQNIDDMKAQMLEMKQTMDLMRQALLNQNQSINTNVSMNQHGELIGEFDKYLVDPSNYPDPTARLADEPRLASLAFKHNYELEYEVGISAYQTKSGKNIREPKFNVTLNRVVIDDQGNTTSQRYIARKLVFHEDPQAALVIAREQNIEVNKGDERLFLNEMRYLRVRDWLFGIFWPVAVRQQDGIREQVIGNQLVQVFTKSSEESSSIPFDQMNKKLSV